MHAMRLLEDPVGGGEAVIDVAGVGLEMVNDVVRRVVRTLHVRFVMDHGCTVDDRFVLVEDGGEHLVYDVDHVTRSEGDLLGVCGERRDTIPDVADLVVEAHLVVGERIRVALTAGCVSHPGHVSVMQHGVDSGEGKRLGGVDGDDPGVGVRTVEHFRDEGPGEVDIIGERRIPLCQLDRVDLVFGLPDDAGFRNIDARNDAWGDLRERSGIGGWSITIEEGFEVGDVDGFWFVSAHYRSGSQYRMDRA